MRFRRRKPDYQHIAALEAEAETLDRIIDGADPLEVLSRELDRRAVEPHAFKPPILKKREPIPFAHLTASAAWYTDDLQFRPGHKWPVTDHAWEVAHEKGQALMARICQP